MIKLELSEQIVSVIMDALAKQPLGQTFEAFVTIRSQLAQQRMPGPPLQQATPTPPTPSTPPNGADHSE